MSSSSVLSLPPELLIKILEVLDYKSASTCQRVCKAFQELINSSVTIKYQVALSAGGLSDGPPSLLTPSERLKLLQNHQRAWERLDWSYHEEIEMHTGGLWELYGNVLVQSRGPVRRHLAFHQLPSRLRGIEERKWDLITEFTLRDFGIDPSQDLLVLLEARHPHGGVHHIHLRSLSTGKEHGLASKEQLLHPVEFTTAAIVMWSYAVQVNGDYLGVAFTCEDDEIDNDVVVWNWKTGDRLFALRDIALSSFTFLSDTYILVGCVEGPESQDGPSMLVYDFIHTPTEEPSFYGVPYVASFEWPTMRPDIIPLDLMIRSDPAPVWTPDEKQQVPFHTSHTERLLVINYTVIVSATIRGLQLYVPSSTLLERVNSLEEGIKRHSFPWDSWGPTGSRLTKQTINSAVWVCYVFGMKYISQKPYTFHGEEMISVTDYHPLRVRRVLCAQEGEKQEWKVTTDPTFIEGGWLQQGPVESSLPYLRKEINLPDDIVEQEDVALMISEDTLIALEKVSTSPRTIHLYTF